MNTSVDKGMRNVSLSLLTIWFVAALLAGYVRVFDSGSPLSMSVPLPLGLAAVLPILGFGIAFLASKRFRTFALSLNPIVLTTVQTWRVAGIVFLILYGQGILPRSFAFPAGFGDMAIGITAPLIAWSLARKKLPFSGYVLWQFAGMADLVTAVVTGVLSTPTRIGILAHGITTRPMGLLPMSLIPTFAVPLFFILHLISIAQARQTRSKRSNLSVSSLPLETLA